MGVLEITKEALRIARTHKSLWLFGFFVGLGRLPDGGGDQQPPVPAAATPPDPGTVGLIVLGVIAVIVAYLILRFLSAGALIEGVRRARRDGSMTVGEGFREGWAHWGVLFRITLLYFPVYAVSVAVLVGACAFVLRAFGSPAIYVAGGAAFLVGVPWLTTLYMWQAFAERIAVLENRRALDAIAKARLFLHGRVQLGLKLLVAGFLGVLFVGLPAVLVTVPLVLLARVWGFPVVAVSVLTLPVVAVVAFVALAFVGIITSSVWTIGYLTQVEQ